MQCINHPEVAASAFCQSCGKALCSQCTERTPIGQVFCVTCRATGGAVPPPGTYPVGSYPPGAYPAPAGSPNPGLAAFLGLIPGVGAMYNGQFFKGMIHVVIFAVLVTLADRYAIVGLFIAAWILYQSFEAFHTARARRDGLPLPDPFGINELGSWLNLGGHSGASPGAPTGFAQPRASSVGVPPVPGEASTSGATAPPPGGSASPFTQPYTGSTWPNPQPEADPYAPYPPIPPTRNLPVGAVVLIALGILFLLQSMGFVAGIMRFSWPLLLIGLGVWLIISRTGMGGPRS